jgi:hypothetical protein
MSPYEYAMAHFDALPPALRNFLANANHSYNPVEVYDIFKEEGETLTLLTLKANEVKNARKYKK